MNFLTADFGSTYTKLTAINAENATIVGTASAFTTIETDIIDGFNEALARLEGQTGPFVYDRLLCCSSAGGGLKMVALGLVPELTAKAAKMAASSAGAKVIKTYSFEISKAEQQEIYAINPDLVLLCGGTDGGNKEVIVANAKRLCSIDRNFTVIAAGNKSARDELEAIFENSGKEYVITDNVMPSFNKLAIEPAKSSIREVFIKKIIDAKGLSRVQAMSSNDVIPTPLAVMAGCELFSEGTAETAGIGEFIAVDLGGATTDVYSMCSGKPARENVVVKGLPEPFSKRTVEGDLGMRYSIGSLWDELEYEVMVQESGLDKSTIAQWVERCVGDPGIIARGGTGESVIEEILAKGAVKIAVERHCGYMESSYTPMGEIFTMTGKDLSGTGYVIGIGGAIIHSANPKGILEGACYDSRKPHFMKPRNPRYMLDKQYIFASMGLLSSVDPELALRFMKQEIQEI